MLCNRETVQVKLPGFRKLEIGNKTMKNAKNACFLHVFSHCLGGFWEKPCKKGQKSTKKVPKGRCTDFPDWFPTGSRLVPDFQKVLEFAESGVKFWPEIRRIG